MLNRVSPLSISENVPPALAQSKPLAAYASIQLKDGAIHIAELSSGQLTMHSVPLEQQEPEAALLQWLKQQSQERDLQFIAVAFREHEQLKDLTSRLWLQEDIVPYRIRPQDDEYRETLEDLVQDIASRFDENNIVYPRLDETHEVNVAELVTLADYQKTATQEDFALLTSLAAAFKGKRLVFLSATPRGGGVALMRHALIRLLHLLEVDARWYVLLPKQEAFDVTKTKFHNVLQAVVPPAVELTLADKAIYETWAHENAVAMEDVLQPADVIVIDDPQPSGLIPYIKQNNPTTKIIYRSHIQIEADLANKPDTPQYTTWSFLWNYIKDADYFISHPIKEFIPECVPAEKIFYMPATTDPLDGLNKPLTAQQMSIYMQRFNDLLLQEGQTPLDEQRSYIIQVARFDPSKGIPDVLEAYRKLRCMLEEEQKPLPQLVITGNSSIDDPDGIRVHNALMCTLQTELYADFSDDIKVMRLPHRDQILDTLMSKCAIALQLSIKEGFEVKVTEALMKGKPIIASKIGGIPLQIDDDLTGYLVDSGNTKQVAQYMYDLLTDRGKYERMSKAAAERANKDYMTVPNALCWLYLALQLLYGEKLEGHSQWVKALAEEHAPQLVEAIRNKDDSRAA